MTNKKKSYDMIPGANVIIILRALDFRQMQNKET